MSKLIRLRSNSDDEKNTIVDDDDFEYLSKWEWKYFNNKWGEYARRYEFKDGKVISILMHREIMQAKKIDYVDHKDRNGLNNRRRNLRLCTNSQNGMNSKKRTHWSGKPTLSKYKGVSFMKASYDKKPRNKRWYAYIKINGKKKSLGYFFTEKEAAIIYDKYAKKHYGEFARTNFI